MRMPARNTPAASARKASGGSSFASQTNAVPISGPRKVLGDDDLIKQPQRASPAATVILAIGKAIYVLGAFAAFHYVKRTQMTPLQLVASTLTVSAALLCALHRPWRPFQGRRLSTATLLLCWKTAACTVVVHWLLSFSLVACAPVRFLILEHLEVLVTYCLGMLFGAKQVQGTKVQGGLLIFAGYVVCLWHDTTPIRASASGAVIVDEVDETNTYDSFVGTCAIGLASFIAVTARRTERQLIAQLGSLKRVHALQAAMALTVLWPLVAMERLLHHPASQSSMEVEERPSRLYTYIMLVFVAFTFCTFRFVLASMQQHLRVPEGQAARTSVAVVTICALFIHTLHSWDTLIAPQTAVSAIAPATAVNVTNAAVDFGLGNDTASPALSDVLETQPTTAPISMESTVETTPGSNALPLSDSIVQATASAPAAGSASVALQSLASSEDASSAFAVYVAAGLVAAGVFRFTMDGGEEQLSRLAQRVLPLLVMGGKDGLMLPVRDDGGGAKDSQAVRLVRQMWRHRTTRRPLGYLVVSLAFALLESVYGWAVGATSLIADAAHVLVDCAAASVSLAAAHMSARPPSSTHMYGGARAEVLGGFINGLMIFVAASGIVTGAAQRSRVGPGTQAWASERLLIVHVLGLAINACGLTIFNEGNPESGMPSAKRPSQNMRGMYLHVLADTLGTVVIVVSSLMRHYFGCAVLDPIASLAVAGFLITLAVPLLKATSLVLLQRQPQQLDGILQHTLGQVQGLAGVEGCHTPHFWCLTPRHLAEGSLKVSVAPSFHENQSGALRGRVSELFRPIEARVLVELERGSAGPSR